MNLSETAAYLMHFDRFRPDYVGWRTNQAKEMAAAHGTTEAAEIQGILTSLANEWAAVAIDEAMDALGDLYAGRLTPPKYFDYATLGEFIRRACVNGRQSKREAERYESHDGERRLECLNCMDQGVVVIFNPYFVAGFRETFEALGGKSAGLTGKMRRWWSAHGDKKHGAISHGALCDCNCRRRQIMAAELEKFLAGQRRRRGESMGPPACGTARWNRDWSPVWPSSVDADLFETLAAFYAGRARPLFGGAA